jgi:hypothetical protein
LIAHGGVPAERRHLKKTRKGLRRSADARCKIKFKPARYGFFPVPLVKMVRNLWFEKCLPLVDCPDCAAQAVDGSVFYQIAHRAAFGRLFHIHLIIMHGK